MSDAENIPPLEELAALEALNLLDATGQRELSEAAGRDAEADRLARDFAETAALLAYDAPEVSPPPSLKLKLLRELPAGASTAKIIRFPQWIPYAVAAGLMALGIAQSMRILALNAQLQSLATQSLTQNTELARLQKSNEMLGLRLATLDAGNAAKADAAYAAAKIMVAWDPYRSRGVVAMANLPVPPAGHDYQLWVLDPKAPAPVNAGLITGSRPFAVKSVGTPNPGFAISLEPAGGSIQPSGPILFAVEPGQ